MKKTFLKKTFLFSLPIVLFILSFEALLRHIPNDYKYKKTFLDQKSNTIQTLFLGSSHAYFGLNPIYMHTNSFNASYFSQTIKYDIEILKKYDGHWDRLQYIVIPISYFTLFSNLETDIESWRVKNYTLYCNFKTSCTIKDYSEFLSNNFKINLLKLYSYYQVNQNTITCSELGFGLDYHSKSLIDLQKSGIEAAKRHTAKDFRHFEENMNYLTNLIQYASSHNIKILLFTPPAFHTYADNLNKEQLNKTISSIETTVKAYPNVYYFNFLTNPDFIEEDFYDADHLDDVGAKKLTLKIDSIITNNLQIK